MAEQNIVDINELEFDLSGAVISALIMLFLTITVLLRVYPVNDEMYWKITIAFPITVILVHVYTVLLQNNVDILRKDRLDPRVMFIFYCIVGLSLYWAIKKYPNELTKSFDSLTEFLIIVTAFGVVSSVNGIKINKLINSRNIYTLEDLK
jgi:hypothetical protein